MATKETSQTGPGPAGLGMAGLELPRMLTLMERRVAARLGAALGDTGATVEEWRVLSQLGDGAGHPMSEIAEFALLPAPTLTKVVDRLVSAGRVYRRVDDADRRRVLVFLSERGHTTLDGMNSAVAGAWADVRDSVGPEELALLEALLTRMAARLA